MQVSKVMTANPETADANDSLQSVAAKMAAGNFGSLPVLSSGKLAGVVTDRDIVVRGVAKALGPETPVSDVMTAEPVCIDAASDVKDAAKLMQQRQIRRLYVTKDGKLAGVVALGDVALAGEDKLSGETLEKISK